MINGNNTNSVTEGPALGCSKKYFHLLINSIYFDFHFLSVVIAVVIWSVSFVVTKVALTTFPPFGLGLFRFGLASFLIGFYVMTRKDIKKPPLQDMKKLAFSGFLGITVYFSLENLGVKYSTTSDAALIVASYPAITLLLEVLFLRVKCSAASLAGVGLAIAGVYILVSVTQYSEAIDRLFGDVLLILAGIIWACYNFITKSIVSTYSMTTITFYQFAAGAIGFLPLSLFETEQWSTPATESLAAAIFLGVFCSLVAFYLYAYGLRRVSSSTAVMIMNLVPIIGVFFSVVILDEALHSVQLLGGSIIIVGVILSIKAGKKQ
jgi:drug/metabolite transporter (DMT)-like permease